MTRKHDAFFLVGPTAVGKTSLAHRLAVRMGTAILSADSMAVYKGMNIGTAKPSEKERADVDYLGVDIITPDQPFSVADYMAHCQRELTARAQEAPYIVTGGTGLYIKALCHGLDDVVPPNDAIRSRAEQVREAKGVEGLQDWLRALAPDRLDALSDPQNPRRLVRAIEMAEQGVAMPENWNTAPRLKAIGLRIEHKALRARIESRVGEMYTEGLVEEARSLRDQYAQLSETAQQAIGYAECWALIGGELTEEEARARTISRTAQLAKRQMTWFRNQAEIEWIDMDEKTDPDQVESRVVQYWKDYGPTSMAC